MKRMTEDERNSRERSLWYSVLTAVLPLFATVLAAAFVVLCVRYRNIYPVQTIELGTPTPDADVFFAREYGGAAYAIEPPTRYREAGWYRQHVAVNGRSVAVLLRVVDTQAPTAEGVETTVSTLQSPTPDKLLKNLRDQSIVKVSYETAPQFGTVGDYDAAILLEDASGNRARVSARVHVRMAVDAITREAGDAVPAASEYLIDAYPVSTETGVTEEMMHIPGTYAVQLAGEGISAQSTLTVRDTVPPRASGVTRIVQPGETVSAMELVTDVVDATAVTATFVKAPDPDSRRPQAIEIVLTDLGGNTCTVSSTLLYSSVAPIRIEARTTPLAIEELLKAGTYETATLDGTFIPNVPGSHVLAVSIDGQENLAVVEVADTKPPVIDVHTTVGYLHAPQGAEAFAAAEDATDCTLSYLSEPDWTKEAQEVTLVAVDTSGNRSEETFTLLLEADEEPPVLYNVRDRYCYVGEAVSYLREVIAEDNSETEVRITVDASAVDPTKKGEYPVVYTATDVSGNATAIKVTFTFVEAHVSEERAQEVADGIIAKILTDGMTLAEQIEAVYDYVFYNVHYVARSDKTDWRSEAVRALTTGKGDCFSSYSAARLLLEQTDAEILSVERYSGKTRHYWMLVNIGTGWYHYDACRAGTAKRRCFMWTDAQTLRYSKSFWRYDKTLYPPVATEPYSGGN